MIGVLLMETEIYAAPTLAELCARFVDCIKTGQIRTGKYGFVSYKRTRYLVSRYFVIL